MRPSAGAGSAELTRILLRLSHDRYRCQELESSARSFSTTMRSNLGFKHGIRDYAQQQSRIAQDELSTDELSIGESSTSASFYTESIVSGPVIRKPLVSQSSTSFGGIYKPLDENSNRIRMLRLDPGDSDDPLSGKLCQIELHETFKWELEALSYVWGKPTRNIPLQLEDGQLLITDNLNVVLRHLRYPYQERMLWVDAICINQEDLSERSAQVQKMGSIYEAARNVIIWLGPDHHGQAAAAFAALNAATWLKTPECLQEARSAMHKILQCEWFERLWVVQEAIMAWRATLHWGDETMEYADFQQHARTYNQQAPHNQPMWVGEMHNAEASNTRTIMHVLEWTRGMKCSDDRDRLYAILGLPYSKVWSSEALCVTKSIRPDYEKSVNAVYHDFAISCIKNRLLHKLWLFTSHHAPWNPPNSELPSWAPDFAQAALPFRTTRSMVYVTEQRDDLPKPFWIQPELDELDSTGRTLLVAGYAIGSVTCVESRCIGGDSPMQSLCNIASFWLHNFKSSESADTGLRKFFRGAHLGRASQAQKQECRLIEVLLACALPLQGDMSKAASIVEPLFNYRAVRAMACSGSHSCRKVMDTLYQSFYSVHSHQLHRDQRSSEPMGVMDAYEHVRPVWQCHKLYRISDDKFGLGPVAMQRGDIVALIGGAKHPVILRPHNDHYFLVGNTHVSGIKDWELEKKERKSCIGFKIR